MTLLIYIIKTILISGLLSGYYALFLKNRLFHRFNRYFILGIPVFSFLIPAFSFKLPVFWKELAAGAPMRLLEVGQGKLEEAVITYSSQGEGARLSWDFILVICSLLVTVVLSIRLYNTIRYIQLLRMDKPFLKLPEATVYFVSEKGTPFSYFRSIFWEKELELHSDAGKQILRHELFHVKENHSMDILILEITSILLWFNPFLHYLRRELRAIHEYGADAHALMTTNAYAYASLLLMNNAGRPLPCTNPFFKNQIKRRIKMMTKSPSNKKGLLGRLMILPLIAILIALFSFKMQTQFHFSAGKTLRVVIDAGHGGVDQGTSVNGIPEKNINLQIAKKIQQLAPAYHVDVIMTRETDILPGNGQNIENALKYRAELPGRENADLFISIHTNGTGKNEMQDKYSGFDIYIPGSDSKVYDGSVKLGSVITSTLKPDYIISPELKQSATGVMVLKNASVPSILIECGYIDNKTDLAWLQDEKSQEKIARDILEGIRKYADQH